MQKRKINAEAANKGGFRAIGITIATIFGKHKLEPEIINEAADLPKTYRNSLRGVEGLSLDKRARIYDALLIRRFLELEKQRRRNMSKIGDPLEIKDGIYGFLYDNYKSLINEKMDRDISRRQY